MRAAAPPRPRGGPDLAPLQVRQAPLHFGGPQLRAQVVRCEREARPDTPLTRQRQRAGKTHSRSVDVLAAGAHDDRVLGRPVSRLCPLPPCSFARLWDSSAFVGTPPFGWRSNLLQN